VWRDIKAEPHCTGETMQIITQNCFHFERTCSVEIFLSWGRINLSIIKNVGYVGFSAHDQSSKHPGAEGALPTICEQSKDYLGTACQACLPVYWPTGTGCKGCIRLHMHLLHQAHPLHSLGD